MAGRFNVIGELIKSRPYLLGFQKEELLDDLDSIIAEDMGMEKIVSFILLKLFDRSWNDLTPEEQSMLKLSWKDL